MGSCDASAVGYSDGSLVSCGVLVGDLDGKSKSTCVGDTVGGIVVNELVFAMVGTAVVVVATEKVGNNVVVSLNCTLVGPNVDGGNVGSGVVVSVALIVGSSVLGASPKVGISVGLVVINARVGI